MKKKAIKRLQLKKETITVLDNRKAMQLNGGAADTALLCTVTIGITIGIEVGVSVAESCYNTCGNSCGCVPYSQASDCTRNRLCYI